MQRAFFFTEKFLTRKVYRYKLIEKVYNYRLKRWLLKRFLFGVTEVYTMLLELLSSLFYEIILPNSVAGALFILFIALFRQVTKRM